MNSFLPLGGNASLQSGINQEDEKFPGLFRGKNPL